MLYDCCLLLLDRFVLYVGVYRKLLLGGDVCIVALRLSLVSLVDPGRHLFIQVFLLQKRLCVIVVVLFHYGSIF